MHRQVTYTHIQPYQYLPESFGLTKIVSFMNACKITGTLSSCCTQGIHSILVLTIAYMILSTSGLNRSEGIA